MSRFIRELFHSLTYRHHPRFYYDDAVVSYGAGRSMLPDIVLHVPMETMKDVERVKKALAIEGVHRVRCDLTSQTVVVSGNVPPKSLLRRVRWVKRHSSIVSFGAPYAGPSYGLEYPPAYNPYTLESPYASSVYGTRLNELDYGLECGSPYGSTYGSPYRSPYTRSYSRYMHY